MLLGDFFNLTQQEKTDSTIDNQIRLNLEHPIYKGHFPHQPVVPGVCMMQIIAELTSEALGKEVLIKKASQVKFLIPIIPKKSPKLEVKIKYSKQESGSLKTTASIHAGDLTFFKFKGVLA